MHKWYSIEPEKYHFTMLSFVCTLFTKIINFFFSIHILFLYHLLPFIYLQMCHIQSHWWMRWSPYYSSNVCTYFIHKRYECFWHMKVIKPKVPHQTCQVIIIDLWFLKIFWKIATFCKWQLEVVGNKQNLLLRKQNISL